ncbi:hypothetical protein BJ322DRAFT_1113570 [Thelephora terrestris]|uniref:Aip3p/Bud6 N-terminal domain-containing protein n=1 Tax=Thelephora terrestris TaxID=56493 RepID=A0A9P6L1Y9_9AGAM|nr:hypothetical protein BJ322DRAFT_1113570 [Thelephora terrestris]
MPEYMDAPPPVYTAGPKNGVNGTNIGSNVQETVAALLETTKQLQDCLKKWSVGGASDEQVSDVYVDFGTKFNATVTAFMSLGIDISDLYSIPTDLRVPLEDCLGEDASSAVLELYLPRIKQVIYRLLIGLKAKQEPYRIAIAGKKKASR